jgi:sigma-E factor negative regulatory protein RseC
MEEIGRVFEYGQEIGTVRIEIEAKGGCRTCTSRDACLPFGDRRMMTEAINEKGARPGDTVRIEMKPSSTLSAAFLLYILPVIGLILGYALGAWATGEEEYGIIAGLVLLGFSFVLLRILNPMWTRSRRFKPVVVEIVRRGQAAEQGTQRPFMRESHYVEEG